MRAVAAALEPYGLVISSGDTTSVGVGGLLVGGGIGWMVRKYGLAIDHVVGAQIVTAAGEIVWADETQNTELFWAIRGGGGHVGVVTAFELVARHEPVVTVARITYAAEGAAAVLRAWRDVVRTADEGLTSTASLFPAFGDEAPASLVIHGVYAGDGVAAVEPLARLGDVVAKEITVVPYAAVLEEAALAPGWQPMVRNRFADSFTDELIDTLVGRRSR